MRSHFITIMILLGITSSLFIACSQSQENEQKKKEWISIFDGKTLKGWKASEHPQTFSVQDGKIVADGPRAHLFYVGNVKNHTFDDFEFKTEIMTTNGSNSGIFFHTQYQKTGWPSKGYEAQINNSYPDDPRRTGSLYDIRDIKTTLVSDSTWFTMHIKVEDRQISINVNGKEVVNYTEPLDINRTGQVLSSGTFALQAHDPNSKVFFKNIRVRPL